MKIEVKRAGEIDIHRKEALLWGIIRGSEEVVERLLNAGVELPDAAGSFHITVNGIPVCLVDEALAGDCINELRCEYASLQQAIRSRQVAKSAFPAAVVAVRTGACPRFGTAKGAA